MTNVNDNVRISDNIGVVASSSSKQLSSIRTLSLPFFILNILLQVEQNITKDPKSFWSYIDCIKKNNFIPTCIPHLPQQFQIIITSICIRAIPAA
jgi:hypothetical protein